jgi:hypothetical protein
MKLYPIGLAAVMLTLISGAVAVGTASAKEPETVVNPKIPRLNDVAGVGDPKLVEDLRKGGMVIFFRHAATDWSQRDVSYDDFENRAGQRNLSEAGKADAATIGKAFQTLAIGTTWRACGACPTGKFPPSRGCPLSSSLKRLLKEK